jgi:hypothetical protein
VIARWQSFSAGSWCSDFSPVAVTCRRKKPAASSVKLGSSYAEWKLPGALIVDGQKVVVDGSTNFFFSDHSSASARRKSLEDEIRLNHYVR